MASDWPDWLDFVPESDPPRIPWWSWVVVALVAGMLVVWLIVEEIL